MNRDDQLRAELRELLLVFIDYLENTDVPLEVAASELLTQVRGYRARVEALPRKADERGRVLC